MPAISDAMASHPLPNLSLRVPGWTGRSSSVYARSSRTNAIAPAASARCTTAVIASRSTASSLSAARCRCHIMYAKLSVRPTGGLVRNLLIGYGTARRRSAPADVSSPPAFEHGGVAASRQVVCPAALHPTARPLRWANSSDGSSVIALGVERQHAYSGRDARPSPALVIAWACRRIREKGTLACGRVTRSAFSAVSAQLAQYRRV